MDEKLLSKISAYTLKLIDQTIKPDEFEELNSILSSSPEAAKHYNHLMLTIGSFQERAQEVIQEEATVDGVLQEDFWRFAAEDEKKAPEAEIPRVIPKKVLIQNVDRKKYGYQIKRSSLYAAAGSIAAVLLIVLFVQFAPIHNRRTLVAGLSRTVDARWEAVSEEPASGDDLYAGPMNLVSGLAEITMDSGAVVIVEGPARFSLETPDRIFLQQGRLVVKVDRTNETTFMIRSPHATIVDYGTEFGVQVDQQSNTVTHVYQGRVELRSGSDPLRFEQSLRLGVDQAGKADFTEHLSEQKGLAGAFIRQEEFDIKLKAANGSAYHRWLAYSLDLRRDPDVAVYYTFEDARSDALVNVASWSAGDLDARFPDVEAHRPQWDQGRFSQKESLLFDRSKLQFMEVEPDKRYCINGPITIAAWIYCESIEDGGHIVSNRSISDDSTCNYQLGYRAAEKRRQNCIHFARKLNVNDDKNQINSRTPLSDDLTGWVLVAVTHDNQTLKFYLNGKLFDIQNWPQKKELVEAGLKIGTDYGMNDGSSFNGKIDELVIMRRVMGEREIAEMYKAGKP